MAELQRRISSFDFTELLAYRRRNTFQPDLWFAALRVAIAAAGGGVSPDFLPMADPDAERRRAAAAQAAEERLDREDC